MLGEPVCVHDLLSRFADAMSKHEVDFFDESSKEGDSTKFERKSLDFSAMFLVQSLVCLRHYLR